MKSAVFLGSLVASVPISSRTLFFNLLEKYHASGLIPIYVTLYGNNEYWQVKIYLSASAAKPLNQMENFFHEVNQLFTVERQPGQA